MTAILLRKTLGGKLEPVDDLGREVVSRIGSGDVVRAEVKRPRNLGHHRKFWALVSLIYENQTRYRSPEELLDVMKVHLGHCSVVHTREGKEVYIPKSISFAKMDQTEFEQFWDRAVKMVCEHILPGVSQADLEREILDLCA